MAKKKVKKEAAKKPAANKPSGVNKSQLIRDYAAKHPDAKPKAIAAGIAQEHKVSIPPTQISTVLFNARKKGPKKTRVRQPDTTGQVVVEQLVSAKKFADQVGGVANASELLKALQKLG